MTYISIIIPAYNAEKYILNSIDSILKQKQKHLEIIVVDDGSEDDTKGRLAPLIHKGAIKYLYKNNGGAASARNYGLKNAHGNFIGFLDADDTYLPGMISECLSALINENLDLVSVDNYMVYYKNDTEVGRTVQSYEWIEKPAAELFCLFLSIGAIGGVHKAFFRKNVFDKVGCFDTSLPVYEDLDLWVRIAKNGLKWGHIRKPLVEYNHRGSGTSLFTTSQKRNMDCRLRILRRYKPEAIQRFPEMKSVYGLILWDIGRSYLLDYKSYRKALSCILESINTDPNLWRIFSSLKNQVQFLKKFNQGEED